MALKNDGTAVVWGYNGSGESVNPWGLTNVVAISAGGFHTLVVNDGTPCFFEWPTNQSVLTGMSVVFTNTAKGASPLGYR